MLHYEPEFDVFIIILNELYWLFQKKNIIKTSWTITKAGGQDTKVNSFEGFCLIPTQAQGRTKTEVRTLNVTPRFD